MTHRLGATTMPEFFGKRYRSKGLRIAAAAIIFVFLIPYTASVYNGLSRLFGMAFGLPYEWCVIGMAVITCIYVVLGGYMATVMNDFIQGIVMLLGIVAVIVAVLVNNGGFTEAITTLSLIPVSYTHLPPRRRRQKAREVRARRRAAQRGQLSLQWRIALSVMLPRQHSPLCMCCHCNPNGTFERARTTTGKKGSP